MAESATEQTYTVGDVHAQDDAGESEVVGNEEDAQIDSSDEYDPSAHSFQDVSHVPPNPHATDSNPALTLNPSSSTASTPANHTPIAAAPPSLQPPTNPATPAPGQQDGAAPSASLMAPNENATMRLPHDRVGILEDRIARDEKGDAQAWLELIEEYKSRGKLEDARKTYNRFFAIFPTAADERVAMVQMEGEAGNKKNVESIFFKTLKESASLKLWSTYLNHIRRYHNLTLDKTGRAYTVTNDAYQTVLSAVGQDKDSGTLWQEYINFVKSFAPGVLGGSTWQDGQKMDVVRAAYQQAIVVPHQATETIWKDYSNFELGLNKQSGRKQLQDKSPEYMSARSAYLQLQRIVQGLSRTTLPRLPPAPGFDGHEEYMQQLAIWNAWIDWEKSDPLDMKQDDAATWKKRVVYAYKQALMAMRFWPEMWLSAAEFCLENEEESEGNAFLTKGAAANPESALLAFRQADRVEMSTSNGDDEDSKVARGNKVEEPYEACLDALYALIEKVRKSESERTSAMAGSGTSTYVNGGGAGGDNGDASGDNTATHNDAEEQARLERIAAVKTFHRAQIEQLQKTITHVWITMMRAFQRMQGNGAPNAKVRGSRGVFTQARKRGQLTSELFASAAMMEYHNGMKDAAGKIFERGTKLFPRDGSLALDYIKYLVSVNDTTNARAVFETTVSKLLADDDDESVRATAKPLFIYFHGFESRYGELSQISKLEVRMKSAFPDDPRLGSFASRFSDNDSFNAFNPTVVHPIISPLTQCRPRMQAFAGGEAGLGGVLPVPSPRAAMVQPVVVSSPKRPLPTDLAEVSQDRPSKMARAESPLKGAAGRRQAQANAGPTPITGGHASLPSMSGPPAQAPLPRDISFLLSIIPSAGTYNSTRFSPDGMVRLIQNLHIPASLEEWKAMQAAKTQGGTSVNGGQSGAAYWGQR